MFTDHVHYACYQNGEMISESTVLFSVPKYYDYIDPQLSCRVEGDEIIVSAKAYAKSVEVLNENEDWVLEDNYFDLEADKERRIRIVSGDANGIHMRACITFADFALKLKRQKPLQDRKQLLCDRAFSSFPAFSLAKYVRLRIIDKEIEILV